ncbi:unnamed protein product [Cylicocyclus nassatus]|uniref:SH3 domain-containing protein n=1 Tax=Cylicocyclus nassatus TaxID=53992 RepID=A0AA36GCS3_CYLNA|nr:unnamed protein product [Cylicocyclus nassatus]
MHGKPTFVSLLQDRNAAFEETKQFALQSLASVAYQINTLARDLLDMLDLQTDKISSLTGQVDNIDVVVNIHEEKLARREIGALTTNKSLQKQPKIIAPATQEPVQRYKRTPIDFSVLDGIGHGVRVEACSISKSSRLDFSRNYAQYERTANIGTNTVGTLRLHQSQVPRASMVDGGSVLSEERPDSPGFPLPLPQLSSNYGCIGMTRAKELPPPAMQMLNSTHEDELLPPPPHSQANFFDAQADWIPRNYIEKAVALYDYDADKPDELSLRENCIVYVLRKNDDGWFEGVLDGVVAVAVIVPTRLNARTIYKLVEYDKNCPKNEEWADCKNFCIPDCTNPRPPGCQCKKGFIISSAGCVRDCSQENCPRPNEIRSKCIPRPECQRTCFPPSSEQPDSIQLIRPFNLTHICENEPCIPFECECQKGYIRLHNTRGKDRCIPFATCKKLKDQYGFSLPSGFDVTVLNNN